VDADSDDSNYYMRSTSSDHTKLEQRKVVKEIRNDKKARKDKNRQQNLGRWCCRCFSRNLPEHHSMYHCPSGKGEKMTVEDKELLKRAKKKAQIDEKAKAVQARYLPWEQEPRRPKTQNELVY